MLMFPLKIAVGGALYVGTAALLWHLDGRPNGFEGRILEKIGDLRARYVPGR